jgi:outer membrane lipoprotein carrier protein
MNKRFFVNSTLVIALSFVTGAIMPVMAELQVSFPTKIEEIKLEASKELLRSKLANLHFFSAKFTQEVVSEAGELLGQSSGSLAISKPNLANWHTLEPDELAIVSDGSNVWFYNPWIEQVSVYSLSAAIAKTPILLLTSKDESLWQQYTVSQEIVSQESVNQAKVNQQSDRFVITAKDPNSQIKSLTLVFSAKNKQVQGSELSQFSFLDATGQVSHIKLSNFNAQKVPESSLFTFVLPEGVQIDDQRAN